MKKIKTSALIGLGALGILFGRKMPGVQVIADEDRIARYSAEPVVCNGEVCSFRYVTPAEGKPVDLLLVAVKATVLEQAIQDIAKFVGPDTVILSVLNGITSEEHIDAAIPATPCGALPSAWTPPAPGARWCSIRRARSSSVSAAAR